MHLRCCPVAVRYLSLDLVLWATHARRRASQRLCTDHTACSRPNLWHCRCRIHSNPLIQQRCGIRPCNDVDREKRHTAR